MKKNEEYIVDVVDHGYKGEGIAKIDGQTIFIPHAIQGEKVKIKILKVNTSHAYAKLLTVIEKSPFREETDCATYWQCGGCGLRHIAYDETILMKKKAVEVTLCKALGRPIVVSECIKMDNPHYYRNKLQYPVGVDEKHNPVMGVFAERTHHIIPTVHCKIQNLLSQKIAQDVYAFICKNHIPVYCEKELTGSIRHVVVRVGIKTNQVMITIVSNTPTFPKEKEFVEYMTTKYPEIKTIAKNINSKNTNVIFGNQTEILFGNGYIYDYLGDYQFKISPMSFYQVNPVQTEKLYAKAVAYAELTGKETILDLYCGIGTIGIFASKNVKKLYGIETIPEAIEDAKENAKLNNVNHAEFFVGDVENTLPLLLKEKNITADVVFVDPPRKGCDKTALETILKIEPKKIVYVSCNPATLGRDLKVLEDKYILKDISICDMFPYSHHVECCSVLSLKNSIE